MNTKPQSKPKLPEKPGLNPAPQLNINWRMLLWYLPFVLFLLWFWQEVFFNVTVRTIPYSEFKGHVARQEVKQCEIQEAEILGVIETTSDKTTSDKRPASSPPTPDATTPQTGALPATTPENSTPEKKVDAKAGEASATAAAKTDKPQNFVFRTIRVEDPKLVEELEAAGTEFGGVRRGFLSQFLLSWALPLGLMFLLWTFLSRRLGAAGQAVMSIGKSKAKLVADKDTGVTFNDVAGCDEAKFELQEVVDFLQNPARYVKLGARIPKGVLLVGLPGTGKTLLARAVAGEAHVPFFSLSGSDFVEMFVGVGAARVRDLFDQATANAPCIVFIDELDAIGRQRGVHVGANVMNEAALLAARRRVEKITQADLEESVDKVVAGPERKSRRLGPEEKQRVAYHEVGHALVGTYSEHADPVHKISIVPRGRAALGYTLQLPTSEQFLMTRSELFDRLKGLLGGRAAEDVVYGETSTGAENDLERATALARQMICSYGMSDKIGLVHCAQREGLFLVGGEGSNQVDCSPATAELIDNEVKQLLDAAYADAKKLLTEHRAQLDAVARELLEKETLAAEAFQKLISV